MEKKYEKLLSAKEELLGGKEKLLEAKMFSHEHTDQTSVHAHPDHTSTHAHKDLTSEHAELKYLNDELKNLDDARDEIQGFTVLVSFLIRTQIEALDIEDLSGKSVSEIQSVICKRATMKARNALARGDNSIRQTLHANQIQVDMIDRPTIQLQSITIEHKFRQEFHLNTEHEKTAKAESKEHDIYMTYLKDIRASMKNQIITERDAIIKEVELVKQEAAKANHVHTPYLDEAVIEMKLVTEMAIREVENVMSEGNQFHDELILLATPHADKAHKSIPLAEFVYKATESINLEIEHLNSFARVADEEFYVINFEMHQLKLQITKP